MNIKQLLVNRRTTTRTPESYGTSRSKDLAKDTSTKKSYPEQWLPSSVSPIKDEAKIRRSSSSWLSLDFFLEPTISKGRFSLPLQADCKMWLKYLVLSPLFTITIMALMAFVWFPAFQLIEGMEVVLWRLVGNPVALSLMVIGIALAIARDVGAELAAGIMLLRGKRRRHIPENLPRLVHAVIVCQYKEPLEVLDATIESLALNTLAKSTIIVLACEGRDSNADEVFETLKSNYGHFFRSFIKTTHHLQPGEVAGKSSNENHAAQELYSFVKDEMLDPYQVMVTTCDADSLFDAVFLEQLEGEFHRMPDGRRFIYNSPINTYRNLPECNLLVKFCEIERSQGDVFNMYKGFQAAQSNYSMTLGFCHEINYWDPSNTSEDYHTTLKAMAYTANIENIVVPVCSLILNDSVPSLRDRWIQAKRHMWGIEEVAFAVSLYPVLRLSHWLTMFYEVSKRMFGPTTPLELFLLMNWRALSSLLPETKLLLLQVFVAWKVFDWTKVLLREVFLYKFILSDRKHLNKGGLAHWIPIILGAPFMIRIANFIFYTLATWRMLLHAMKHDTLVYVVAPKALNSSESTSLFDKNKDLPTALPVEV